MGCIHEGDLKLLSAQYTWYSTASGASHLKNMIRRTKGVMVTLVTEVVRSSKYRYRVTSGLVKISFRSHQPSIMPVRSGPGGDVLLGARGGRRPGVGARARARVPLGWRELASVARVGWRILASVAGVGQAAGRVGGAVVGRVARTRGEERQRQAGDGAEERRGRHGGAAVEERAGDEAAGGRGGAHGVSQRRAPAMVTRSQGGKAPQRRVATTSPGASAQAAGSPSRRSTSTSARLGARRSR